MTQMIFVNLPVQDVKRSREFYQALGFSVNEQFSDDNSACIVISDAIYLMVLNHTKFASFSPKPIADTITQTASLIALTCNDRAAVDAMTETAVANGGTDNEKVQDMDGFMYGRSFCDPDGHVFEPFWMNPDAI